MLTRSLGRTGLVVSALGLGTVKFGRNTGVKYPRRFDLPSDEQIADLLATAKALGVTLLDTAPAYGDSERRLGEAIGASRRHWVLCTKVGETFDGCRSRYDFTASHTLSSVDRSLRRLRTDTLDIVLLHADDRGAAAIAESGALQALRRLQREGVVRAVGYSGRGVADGRAMLGRVDVLMCAINAVQRDEVPLAAAAAAAGVGVLVKKPLASGHHPHGGIGEAARLPGVASVVVGTLNTRRLVAHAEAVRHCEETAYSSSIVVEQPSARDKTRTSPP